MRGWFYVLSNPEMSGLLKVGRTTEHPRMRAAQLHTTGVPTPFKWNMPFGSIVSTRLNARSTENLSRTGCTESGSSLRSSSRLTSGRWRSLSLGCVLTF